MATHALNMGALTRAPFIPAPPAAVTRMLSRFDRRQLAGFITVAIDLLDFADGDPDLEPIGDETDGDLHSEDEFMLHSSRDDGAGCPLADPGGCQHDDREHEEGV